MVSLFLPCGFAFKSSSIIISRPPQCVPLTAKNFASAVLAILEDDDLKVAMQKKGTDYVNKVRGYQKIATEVSATYYRLISKLS